MDFVDEPLSLQDGEGPSNADNLELDLLNNGIDFVRSGVEHFFDSSNPRALKYAILHLFAGVLLLFKERLSREHPSLIFQKPHEVLKENAKTIHFDEALSRLAAHASLTFTASELSLLRTAQRFRNRVEHYRFDLDLKEAQSLAGRLSEFIYLFLRDHLETALEEHLDPVDWFRLKELRDIAKRIEEERIEEWRGRAEKYLQMTPEERQELVDQLEPFHPRHNPEPEEFHFCEQCSNESLLMTEDPDIAVCTDPDCGNLEYVGRCLRCKERIFGDDDTFCRDCLEYIDSDRS